MAPLSERNLHRRWGPEPHEPRPPPSLHWGRNRSAEHIEPPRPRHGGERRGQERHRVPEASFFDRFPNFVDRFPGLECFHNITHFARSLLPPWLHPLQFHVSTSTCAASILAVPLGRFASHCAAH